MVSSYGGDMNALWFFLLAGVTYASVDKGRPADGTRRGQERHLERSDTWVHPRSIINQWLNAKLYRIHAESINEYLDWK